MASARGVQVRMERSSRSINNKCKPMLADYELRIVGGSIGSQ